MSRDCTRALGAAHGTHNPSAHQAVAGNPIFSVRDCAVILVLFPKEGRCSREWMQIGSCSDESC